MGGELFGLGVQLLLVAEAPRRSANCGEYRSGAAWSEGGGESERGAWPPCLSVRELVVRRLVWKTRVLPEPFHTVPNHPRIRTVPNRL